MRDTTPPNLTLVGAPADVLECGGRYADPGIIATDACAGPLTSAITETGTVNGAVLGSTTLTYTAKDPSGNSASIQRAVTVRDTTAPTLTLVGASTMTLECNAGPFVEPGARATDVCAGDLSSRIVASGMVDVGHVGSYAVGYSVSDPSGNAAAATRAVGVVDTTPPVVTVQPERDIWPPNHKYVAFDVTRDCVASAVDLCTGPLTLSSATTKIVSIYSSEPDDGSTPIVITGPTTFQVRSERTGAGDGRVYGVTVAVHDASGNVSSAVCKIGVPHDQKSAPVDHGAKYTVVAK
ncbi:MAG: hypothetical protein NVSMB47_06990 [Polyangiales bacterium]